MAKTIRLPDEDDEVARIEAAAKIVGERKMAEMRRGAEKSPVRPPPPSHSAILSVRKVTMKSEYSGQS